MLIKRIRFLLTEKCNANCKNCFNSDYRINNEMDIDKLETTSDYFSKYGISSVKIMGGEPTIHTRFYEAVDILQKHFKKINIFTNAISSNLFNINLRNEDSIVYNFNFLNEENIIKKLMLEKNGFRTLEIQVNNESKIENIKKTLNVLKQTDLNKKVGINLTLDCTYTQSFDLINSKVNFQKIENYIRKNFDLPVNYDHKVPACIRRDNHGISKNSFCYLSCAGLIDSNFNILFCNQFPKNLGNLYANEKTIHYDDFNQRYKKCFDEKIKINSQKKCKNCKNFLINCNGGCFMHRLII